MKFSICLHTYKGAHDLGMAREGIFNPDYQDFEILIGYDNSPDALERRQATLNAVSCFEQSRIRYTANERDLGYAHNLKNIIAMQVAASSICLRSTMSWLNAHNARLTKPFYATLITPFFAQKNLKSRCLTPY
jgi:hypothetical protein